MRPGPASCSLFVEHVGALSREKASCGDVHLGLKPCTLFDKKKRIELGNLFQYQERQKSEYISARKLSLRAPLTAQVFANLRAGLATSLASSAIMHTRPRDALHAAPPDPTLPWLRRIERHRRCVAEGTVGRCSS